MINVEASFYYILILLPLLLQSFTQSFFMEKPNNLWQSGFVESVYSVYSKNTHFIVLNYICLAAT